MSKTTCFTMFLGPTPLMKGVEVQPFNYGGMGCQGKFSLISEEKGLSEEFLRLAVREGLKISEEKSPLIN